MRSVFVICALGLTFAFVLMGCADNAEDAYAKHHGPPAHSFTHGIQQLQSHPGRSRCDKLAAARQLEMAQELDARRDFIERYLHEATLSAASKIPFGPIHLVEDERPQPLHSMDSFKMSWSDTYMAYRTARVQDNLQLWAGVLLDVSSLMVDDLNRHAGLSMGLDDNCLPLVRRLREVLERCVVDDCETISLNETTMKYVHAGNPTYRDLYWRFTNATLYTLKRQIIRDFAQQVAIDLSFFSFSVNDTIRVQGNVLLLPLEVGDFAGQEEALQSMIEAVWQSPELQVKVQWVQPGAVRGAYRFVAHPTPGRNYVSRQQRTINLYEGSGRKALVHEIGHVLGLADHYYTRWEEAACQYHTACNDRDLMSMHTTGQVTSSEWNELMEHYEVGD